MEAHKRDVPLPYESDHKRRGEGGGIGSSLSFRAIWSNRMQSQYTLAFAFSNQKNDTWRLCRVCFNLDVSDLLFPFGGVQPKALPPIHRPFCALCSNNDGDPGELDAEQNASFDGSLPRSGHVLGSAYFRWFGFWCLHLLLVLFSPVC